MKRLIVWAVSLTVTCAGLATNALAQKGIGEPIGVARQPVKPDVVPLSGKIVEIKTGPCEKTTGRALIGTHLLLENDKGQRLNIHLGPSAAVADTVAKLTIGQEVTVQAFRTEKMPENHYTAQTLAFGRTTVELREAGLRPVWAGPSASPTPPGLGRGQRGGGPPWAGGRGQGGRGGGPPWADGMGRGAGLGPDAAFQTDRSAFHFLLDSHDQIKRSVTPRADGVETLTESDNPTVALAIQSHAEAMQKRMENARPIHLRDPLFAAIFGQAKNIDIQVTKTRQGVRVVETSQDPFAAKLIQAHAAVVDRFVANGFAEAWQDHAVRAE